MLNASLNDSLNAGGLLKECAFFASPNMQKHYVFTKTETSFFLLYLQAEVMAVQLSNSEEQECKELGMSDKVVQLVQKWATRRAQPHGPARMTYTLQECKLKYLMTIVSKDNKRFRRMCGFSYHVFDDLICKPLEVAATELKLSGDRKWARTSQVPFAARVFRMLQYLKGHGDVGMFVLYDQDSTTCTRDAKKMVVLAHLVLVPLWIHLPCKDSPDYAKIRGAGVFATDMKQTICAADMTSISIPRPKIAQRLHWDAHHKVHALNFLTMVDGHGYTRYVAGPWPGSFRDTVTIHNVSLTRRLKR